MFQSFVYKTSVEFCNYYFDQNRLNNKLSEYAKVISDNAKKITLKR